jgi:hypothetical protein
MGDLHDRKVEELYETLDFLINDYERDVFWDEVYTELDYFEGQVDPRSVPDYSDRGKQVGEMDVVLVKDLPAPEENFMKYFEVKPERCGTSYAEDQMQRAQDFFGPRGWTVLTEAVTVPEWEDNWYTRARDVNVDDLSSPSEEDSGGNKYSTEGRFESVPDDFVTRVEREFLSEFD